MGEGESKEQAVSRGCNDPVDTWDLSPHEDYGRPTADQRRADGPSCVFESVERKPFDVALLYSSSRASVSGAWPSVGHDSARSCLFGLVS